MQHPLIKILVISFFMISAVIQSANADTMRIGFFGLTPHTFISSDNTVRGAAIDYLSVISAQMGVTDINFSEFPLKRLLKNLENNMLDAAVALGKNPERAAKFAYPRLPFYKMHSAIVVKKDNPLNKITTAEDMFKLKIGVYEKGYYSPMMRDHRLKRIPMNWEEMVMKAYKMIMMGRIDAFYSPDSYELKYKLIQSKYGDKLRLLLLPEPETGLFTVFSKAGAEKYLKKYEEALAIVRRKKPYADELESFIEK